MSQRHSRFYRDECDLERMLAFVTASAQRDGYDAGHLHRGDVVWGLFQNLTIVPETTVCLFEDHEGALLGFVWLSPPGRYGIHVDTTLPGQATTIAKMVHWAEAHLASSALDGDPIRTVVTEVASTDHQLKATLTRIGYRPNGNADYQLNSRDLVGSIAKPVLPMGAVIRPIRPDVPAEIEARVALHREVWHPSRFTVDGYLRLRTKPVYRPELDLVVVTPDERLASYCIVWWDTQTQTGEFEPVGTSVQFRGLGFWEGVVA